MDATLAALVAHLHSGNPSERQTAAQQLAQLEHGAQAAAVALVETAATEDDELREWVVAALEALGPPRAEDVRRLAALLKQPSLDVAYWAATLLGRLESAAAPAVPELTDALRAHPEIAARERVAWALGKIGPPAAAAENSLSAAAASQHARLARVARQALEQIGR